MNCACGSDDLTAQNGVAVVANARGMVSECHAGDVDFAVVNFQELNQ